MTKKNQIWKCNICGNIIEVLHNGIDSLTCCKQSMKLMVENSVDASVEKHRPVVEGRKIKIGSIAHPMTEDHHIEWIEISPREGRNLKIFLKPGDLPEIEACFEAKSVRAYCNLHGLWSNLDSK